jgi:transcriptional regulator with XRE-family HTH domain
MGLTQTQLAQKVGIRPQHINGIEHGSKIPSAQLIKSISRELGIREDWLRNGREPVFIPINEELIKLMARYGRRALLEQCIKLAREEGDIYFQNQLKESLDSLSLSVLYRMAQYLIEAYTRSDQKTRHWIEVQFEKAFPEFKEAHFKMEYKKEYSFFPEGYEK